MRNWRDSRIADSSRPHCWSVSRGPPPGAAGSSWRSSQPMCHSAVAGMKGSSSSPHSASIRSSASADVSGLKLRNIRSACSTTFSVSPHKFAHSASMRSSASADVFGPELKSHHGVGFTKEPL